MYYHTGGFFCMLNRPDYPFSNKLFNNKVFKTTVYRNGSRTKLLTAGDLGSLATLTVKLNSPFIVFKSLL